MNDKSLDSQSESNQGVAFKMAACVLISIIILMVMALGVALRLMSV